MKKIQCNVFAGKDELWLKASQNISGTNIGISGGSAGEIIQFLNKSEEWFKKEFWLIDERLVDYESKHSNYGCLKKLGKNLKINGLSISVKLPDYLDTVIMGVGRDGHFASIFGSEDINQKSDIINSKTNNHQVTNRISLSFNYLLKSHAVMIILIGPEKKFIFEGISQNNIGKTPIDRFLREFEGKIWVGYTE